jgi:hypothetical protein
LAADIEVTPVRNNNAAARLAAPVLGVLMIALPTLVKRPMALADVIGKSAGANSRFALSGSRPEIWLSNESAI